MYMYNYIYVYLCMYVCMYVFVYLLALLGPSLPSEAKHVWSEATRYVLRDC